MAIAVCFKMPAFNRRRLLVYALYIYQRNRETEGVLKKSLSVLLFMESRRIFLIQQYLNHLKNVAMVDHFIRKKHDENQDHQKWVPIPPDFRLTVTIYFRGDYIYTIGEMCGLATATVCTIISENCAVIIKTL